VQLTTVATLIACVTSAALSSGDVDEIAGDARQHERLPPIVVSPRDWPWWRGPNRDGIAIDQDVPIEFGPDKNVAWRAELPGRGHASPIVWGDRIVVHTADESDQTQWLLAYDRRDGRPIWKTKLHSGGFQTKVHRVNSHASATPACDGQRVFAVYVADGFLWTSAVSLNDGAIEWQTRAGAFDSIYGFGMSPAIHESLVIVNGDNDQTGAFLAAMHRKTGRIVWRIRRPKIDTYATPIVARVAGRDQVLLGGSIMAGYDPNNGRELWRCDGPTAETTANTVAFSRDTIYVSGGYPKPYTLIGVRGDGSGDVTATHRLWTVSRRMPYVPSPLWADGLLFIVEDFGIASCVDAADGKIIWSQRLGGDVSSSPVKCGDRIYVASETGKVYVFLAARNFELLAENNIHDPIMATPTICGGGILVRTERTLFSFGAPQGR